MNYELAKKLKDAGFPSQCWEITQCIGAECNAMTPSLSELLESCGERFRKMSFHKHGKPHWEVQARGLKKEDGRSSEKDIHSTGSTPEEAVANLWLELNKK